MSLSSSIDTASGSWDVRLRPRGAGRFLTFGFLSLWLCGWAAGEAFVLWILATGGRAFLTGVPPASGRSPLPAAPTVAAGIFLCVWFTFWTLGGIAAIREWLRSIWAEDHISAGPDLTITRRIGPFRSVRSVDRGDMRRLYLLPCIVPFPGLGSFI